MLKYFGYIKICSAFVVLCIGMSIVPEIDAYGQPVPIFREKKRRSVVTGTSYDKQMLRLSELLGGMHYLRNLCNQNEGQMWRDEMSNLIDLEDPSEIRRALFVARFNRTYRALREIYSVCTPSAVEIANKYKEESALIANELISQYSR